MHNYRLFKVNKVTKQCTHWNQKPPFWYIQFSPDHRPLNYLHQAVTGATCVWLQPISSAGTSHKACRVYSQHKLQYKLHKQRGLFQGCHFAMGYLSGLWFVVFVLVNLQMLCSFNFGFFDNGWIPFRWITLLIAVVHIAAQKTPSISIFLCPSLFKRIESRLQFLVNTVCNVNL